MDHTFLQLIELLRLYEDNERVLRARVTELEAENVRLTELSASPSTGAR